LAQLCRRVGGGLRRGLDQLRRLGPLRRLQIERIAQHSDSHGISVLGCTVADTLQQAVRDALDVHTPA
jgi:hypothetical protein